MPKLQTEKEHIPEDGLLMTLGWYFKNIFADSVLISGVNNHQDKLWDQFETDLTSAAELV
jgi:hypothetical protein